jgi:AraC-like DNA-binding protein
MDALETGTLSIKARKLEECAVHISRLSIRVMLNGTQYYRVGSHEHILRPDKYLIVNQGQMYRTAFADDHELEMMLVAFQPAFADDILRNMITPEDKLLDDPEQTTLQPVVFFEHTYDLDPQTQYLFSQLRRLMHSGFDERRSFDVDEIYRALILQMLSAHRNISLDLGRLDSLKLSTRVELYRRVHLAREYLDAHTGCRISLEDLSRVACMSPHHFKRTFKRVIGETPHTYHLQKRLDLARHAVSAGVPVHEAGSTAGFENASAFIRLFKSRYGCTPGSYVSQDALKN